MDCLAIDIGGSHIKAAIVNGESILAKKVVMTPRKDQTQFLELIDTLISDYLGRYSFQKIGIAVPGKIDTKNGIVYHGGSLPYLNKLAIKQLLTEKWQVPVVVMNDAKAAAYAEWRYGALKNSIDGAVLVLGTGAGSGLIIDGKPFNGVHYQAGEASFILQDEKITGAESFAGFKCSAVALIKKLARLLKVEAEGQAVFDRLKSQTDKDTSESAQVLLSTFYHDIALLIFNMHVMLDLEVVALSGEITQERQVVYGIQDAFHTLYANTPLIRESLYEPKIVTAKYSADANLVGVARKE